MVWEQQQRMGRRPGLSWPCAMWETGDELPPPLKGPEPLCSQETASVSMKGGSEGRLLVPHYSFDVHFSNN